MHHLGAQEEPCRGRAAIRPCPQVVAKRGILVAAGRPRLGDVLMLKAASRIHGRQRLDQRALAAAVLAHDGVNFALVDGEIDTLKDVLPTGSGDLGVEVLDFE